MRYNVLISGEAGQGPNHLTKIFAKYIIDKGFFVFYSRTYESRIRGGNNFNVITFSDEEVHSNDSRVDVIVALDDKSEIIHKKTLKSGGKIIKTNSSDEKIGEKICEILNIKASGKSKGFSFLDGSQGLARGAVNSGLDIYYAYPMTPATPLLFELASMEEDNNIFVFQLENEIAVANAGIGSAVTGAKVMVGTSGGGFDLMTEALSMTGQAEVPLVFYLSQRPGPGTGVPTYTMQSDLKMALHSGHGEFQRLVLAPGDPVESAEIASQAFYMSQKFRAPVIIIGDKHLAESSYSMQEKPKLEKSNKVMKLMKYNSYEASKEGFATDDAKIIKENFERRLKKAKEIAKEASKFSMYKAYGKKSSKNIVISWGSTKGAILDAIEDLDVQFIQVLYLDPFPNLDKMLQGKNLILAENNSTGMLADLLMEKCGIRIDDKNKILRYDARPFLADELNAEIKRRLK
jgi:2-oxoglutarate/2-oxoacid ferredoxin oxidoreductase subunit alpha